MARRARGIPDAYQPLFRVPKSAVIDFLFRATIDRSNLQVAFNEVCRNVGDVSPTALAGCSTADVIRVFVRCAGVTEGDASYLFDQFRYRGQKTLYVHEFTYRTMPETIVLAELNETLSVVEQRFRVPDSEYYYAQLCGRDTEVIEVGDHDIDEIAYGYIASVRVTDPKSEYPTLVDDLRFGFVWMDWEEGWIGVCARDEMINAVLLTGLAEHYVLTTKRVSIPKHVLRQLESDQYLRRATLFDPSTGTRRRWTNPHMATEDPQALREYQERDRHDERPASGYNETLSDDTNFALGYDCNRGRIFISKDLTVTQLRSWGPRKVAQLVSAVRDMRNSDPVQVADVVANRVLLGTPSGQKEIIKKIALAVAQCKRDGLTEIDVDFDAIRAGTDLGKSTAVACRVDCDSCGEFTEIRCRSCHGERFRFDGRVIVCTKTSCGQRVDVRAVECVEGHRNRPDTIADIVHVYPDNRLREKVRQLVAEATAQELLPEEDFYLRGARLVFSQAAGRVEYRMSEIPELSNLLPHTPSTTQGQRIHGQLSEFKEKCRQMSIENCASCVGDRRHPKCLLRLFGLLDSGYTPRPHHGHEFGDYSRTITVDGNRNTQLVVAMKSATPGPKQITHRDKIGQDIVSQVATYRHEGTMDVIGVCLARKLDDRFKAILRVDAKRCGKKLLIMDDDDLVRIVHNAMHKHGMRLQDV